MVVREVVCEGVDWIHPVQDRDHLRALVSAMMNLQVQRKAVSFLLAECSVRLSRTLLQLIYHFAPE